ncbi:MAG: hypothetical protein ABSD74_18555, partial [Rhizomicrobium sp.]|jgi:hypothetical protein
MQVTYNISLIRLQHRCFGSQLLNCRINGVAHEMAPDFTGGICLPGPKYFHRSCTADKLKSGKDFADLRNDNRIN